MSRFMWKFDLLFVYFFNMFFIIFMVFLINLFDFGYNGLDVWCWKLYDFVNLLNLVDLNCGLLLLNIILGMFWFENIYFIVLMIDWFDILCKWYIFE